MSDIRKFPFKSAKVLVPLNNGSYFKKNNFKDVNELDWFDKVKINEENIPKAQSKLKSRTGPTPPVIPDKNAITVVNIARDRA